MTGNRKESFYIEKYGEAAGKIKFQKLLKSREKRSTRMSVTNDPAGVVTCEVCKKQFKRITDTHLKTKCRESMPLTEYIRRYPAAPIVSDALKKLCGFTKDMAIKKYGEEVGLIKWKEYCELQSNTNTFEYKADKYGITEDEFKQYNQSRSTTLKNMVARHGEIEGMDRWIRYCERQKFTTTLEYFVEQYGEELGELRWNQFCTARGNSNNIEFIKQKYNISHTDAEILLANRRSTNASYVSNSEKQFIRSVIDIIGNDVYSCLTTQFCIWDTVVNKAAFYDLTSTAKMKIIEYNGDYWHANPLKYSADYVIKQSGLSASEIWENDRAKKESAERRGFSVFTVWESEYLNDRVGTLKKITNWWNNES